MRRGKAATAKTLRQAAKGGGEPAAPRERLLAVASDLFYREGIRSVGVDEIVAEANVAKMSLYRSFASKDELAAAYLAERDERYWRWWETTVAKHPGDPRRQIKALFLSLAERTTRPNWRGCPFTNAATEFPEVDHPARKIAEANKRELQRRLRDLAAAAGARRPAALADQLVLLFEGAYTTAQTFGADGPAKVVAEAADALVAARLRDGRRKR
ncbi:MAG TPA: TetR/AcrR family transcriptional regulator [Stellaceae bacterium]|nr:TetR/AcrR family transcriptional regulator [Stellaceae bacterium]